MRGIAVSRQSIAALVLIAVIGIPTAIVVYGRSAARDIAVSPGAAAAAGSAQAAQTSRAPASPAERALERARKDGKYAFLLFYRPKDDGDAKMRDVFDRAQTRLAGKAAFVSVDVGAKAESRLIEQYAVSKAPLPLTLVMAPNGAVVNAFPKAVDEKTLAGAFVSPKVAEVSKALQDRKLVTLCLQNARTKHNAESRRAAQQFVGDSSLQGQAVLVTADPAAEAELLKRCGITGGLSESTLVVLLPPGQLVAKVAGATTKEDLLAKLQAALAACGSGCGPSGCGQ